MQESLDWLFLREKPTLALLAVAELDPAYAALVAKRIDSTFPHTSSILSQLEDYGLIKARPEGRVRYLQLTNRGKKVAAELKSLQEALRAPALLWKKADRLKELANLGGSQLCLGPLRRDISRLKASGDDELIEAADEIDKIILAAIGE